MYRSSKAGGFTVVELIIVVAILALVAAMTTIAYRSTQASARDNKRQVSAQIIADQLERYYDEYTAYPSCDSMRSFDSVKNIIPSLEQGVLVDPKSKNKDQPSIICEDLSSDTIGSYALIGDASCSATASCQSFKLRYREEGSGEIKEIASKNRNFIASSPSGPVTPVATAPEDTPGVGGTSFSVNDIRNICSSAANAPAGYNVINTTGNATGTAGNDIIYAKLSGPSRTVDGAAGNDIICYMENSGAGTTVRGGVGDDIIYVADHNGAGLVINGGAGDDVIIIEDEISGGGMEVLGSSGNDTFYIHRELQGGGIVVDGGSDNDVAYSRNGEIVSGGGSGIVNFESLVY